MLDPVIPTRLFNHLAESNPVCPLNTFACPKNSPKKVQVQADRNSRFLKSLASLIAYWLVKICNPVINKKNGRKKAPIPILRSPFQSV